MQVSPSGHLPVTFYRSLNDLPSYKAYAMQGRTYRYYNGPVQYPFGFGLSYTSFGYSWEQHAGSKYTAKDTVSFSVKVNNQGGMDGDEVVQAYIQYPSGERMPVKELKAFRRVHVVRGGNSEALFSIPLNELMKWDLANHQWRLYKGIYKLIVGSHSRDEKLTATFQVPG